ncbi:MAG: acetylxylan esterase [Verrucomicrobia bacterium]|nr:acetylxylan esterase [Verrucomicrobiota bacterium]
MNRIVFCIVTSVATLACHRLANAQPAPQAIGRPTPARARTHDAAAVSGSSGAGAGAAAGVTGPMWDMAALSRAPRWTVAERPKAEGVRAVLYDGLPFEGKPTRVFAWLGLPRATPGRKAPGMVLVHGGGGTAFDEWVRLWTERGYAAIAMDTCGSVPVGSYGKWVRLEQGGPPGWGGWDQIAWPRTNQWTYHAVADAILAHSLLRSLPEVDPDRIGLTGISWGGYLTCILAGVDHRFKLAMPVYGCGFTDQHGFAASVSRLGPDLAARWMAWWDPSAYLPAAPMPLLWVTGSNDFAYTMNALQLSYRLPKSPRTLCVRLRMPHGHGGAGENPRELHVFADSLLRHGAPLARITGQGRNGTEVWATFASATRIVKADLNTTTNTGRWQDRQWQAMLAPIEPEGRVTATLPPGTRVYYFNLADERNCVVSTEHEEFLPDTH